MTEGELPSPLGTTQMQNAKCIMHNCFPFRSANQMDNRGRLSLFTFHFWRSAFRECKCVFVLFREQQAAPLRCVSKNFIAEGNFTFAKRKFHREAISFCRRQTSAAPLPSKPPPMGEVSPQVTKGGLHLALGKAPPPNVTLIYRSFTVL